MRDRDRKDPNVSEHDRFNPEHGISYDLWSRIKVCIDHLKNPATAQERIRGSFPMTDRELERVKQARRAAYRTLRRLNYLNAQERIIDKEGGNPNTVPGKGIPRFQGKGASHSILLFNVKLPPDCYVICAGLVLYVMLEPLRYVGQGRTKEQTDRNVRSLLNRVILPLYTSPCPLVYTSPCPLETEEERRARYAQEAVDRVNLWIALGGNEVPLRCLK